MLECDEMDECGGDDYGDKLKESSDGDEMDERGEGDEGNEMHESGENGESDASEDDENDDSNESDESSERVEIEWSDESDDESFDGHESDESDDSSDDGEGDEGDEETFVRVGTGPDLEPGFFELEHDITTKRSKPFRSDRWTSKTNETELPHDSPMSGSNDNSLDYDQMPEQPYPRVALMYEDKWPPQHTERANKLYDFLMQSFHNEQYTDFIKLYILANHLKDPATANMAVDKIRIHMGKYVWTPSTEVINLVLDSTKKDDGLRFVFAGFFVYQTGSRLDPELPKEFFVLVTQGYDAIKIYRKLVVERERVEGFGSAVRINQWDDFSGYYQSCESLEDSGNLERMDCDSDGHPRIHQDPRAVHNRRHER
jgi:hypothetical protein